MLLNSGSDHVKRAIPVTCLYFISAIRGEDAKEKANTIRTCWVPGINNLGTFGRWAFAKFRSVSNVDSDFDKLIQSFAPGQPAKTK